MRIDKYTKLFFSISEKPGNFGATFFNYAFDYLGINAIYKPLQLNKKFNNFQDFFSFIQHLKHMNASGVSISMPFKKQAFMCCNAINEAKQIGNVNTLIFKDNKTYGYNTDCHAFKTACHDILRETKSAVIYGNGAVADSIKFVLDGWCINNASLTRTKARLPHMREVQLIDKSFSWNIDSFFNYDLLINSTPIGMYETLDDFFAEDIIKNYKYVFDVVANRETNLIKIAKKLNKETITGIQMSFCGACKQLQIYTGIEVNDIIKNHLREYMLRNNYEV